MDLDRPVDMSTMQNRGWRRLSAHIVVFAVVALIYAMGGLDGVEHKLMESRFGLVERQTSSDVVLIGVDSRSIQELETWPWPRRYHASLIRHLNAAGAKRIVLDIDLSSSSSPAEDADLAAAIKEAAGKVILPVFKQRSANSLDTLVYTKPLPMFLEYAQTASINVRPEGDSLVRRYNRVEPWQGHVVPSIAIQLAGTLPDRLDPFYIDYGIRADSISFFSYVDVLRDQVPPVSINGRTVFVGAMAIELGDMLAVPTYGALPGPVLQILAYESVKMGRTIVRSEPAWSFIAALLLVMLLGPCFTTWSWQGGLAATVGVVVFAFGGAVWVQARMPVSVDIAAPMLALIMSYAWSLVRQLDLQSIRLFKQHMAAEHKRVLMNSVVDQSFEGIVITAADGSIKFANPSACQLLEMSDNELTGLNISRFLRTDMHDGPKPVRSETKADILAKANISEIETKSGEQILVEYSTMITSLAPGANPLERRTETRSIYIYTFRDIRESQKAEEALRDAASKAIAADQAKSDLLANVSHELRTPLNAIIGFSSIMDTELFGELGDEKYREYTKDILFSGEHLLELVNNVLTVSRIGSGNYEVSEEYIDLTVLVGDCWNLISGSRDAKPIMMETDFPKNLPRLYGDPMGVRQILLNLLGNAIKFTPEGGSVRVLAHFDENGNLSLTVADNGIGIAQEDMKRVIEPFQQVEGAMKRSHGGVGLGLHIVSELVEMHDARLDIQSELGVGTKIIVTFPRARVEGYENVTPLAPLLKKKFQDAD